MLVYRRPHLHTGTLFFTVSVLTALLMLFGAKRANAQTRAPQIVILGLDSDDAEDQAEALTAAIRSRARSSTTYAFQETTQSLSMLTAALKCPARPDAGCLQKISDQVKSERFIWGTMSKGAGGQVTCDLHLYARGRPDTAVRESYSDNLKDQNDETLRKIAGRLFERLTGTATGTATIHAGEVEGEVWVDHQKKGDLVKGDFNVELPAGTHALEVRARGYLPSRQTVLVTAGKDTVFAPTLTPETVAEPKAGKPLPLKTILGVAAIVGGAALGALAVERLIRFKNLEKDNDGYRSRWLSSEDACTLEKQGKFAPYSGLSCQAGKDATSASTQGWIAAGAGVVLLGAGVVLIATDKSSPESAPKSGRVRLVPQVGLGSGGVLLQGAF